MLSKAPHVLRFLSISLDTLLPPPHPQYNRVKRSWPSPGDRLPPLAHLPHLDPPHHAQSATHKRGRQWETGKVNVEEEGTGLGWMLSRHEHRALGTDFPSCVPWLPLRCREEGLCTQMSGSIRSLRSVQRVTTTGAQAPATITHVPHPSLLWPVPFSDRQTGSGRESPSSWVGVRCPAEVSGEGRPPWAGPLS